jgi:DNA repair protein RadA
MTGASMPEKKIEELPGVGPATSEKLRDAGYTDLMAIAVESPKVLAEVCEIGESTAAKIIASAKQAADVGGFETGDLVLERRKNIHKLTSCSKAFDELMGGGFETQAISEFFGEFGSGKCVSADTPVLYEYDSSVQVRTIEDVYSDLEQRSRVMEYDDGEILTSPKARVLGLVDGRIMPVQPSHIYREKVQEVVELSTNGGRSITLSRIHRLPVMRNGGIYWVPARGIAAGEEIVTIRESYDDLERSFEGNVHLATDRVRSARSISYDDYIYDFIVPQGHTFVGGNIPAVLHNTQICFQLAVNATMPFDRGGLEGEVIAIDTENTFRPERIVQIATALDLDPIETLKKIHVARAFNSHHQMLLVEKAMGLSHEMPVRLMIVDSLTAHFRAEYIGRGALAERQQALNKHMHDLLRFSDLNNAVIAVTNQVTAKPDAFFGDPTRPIGGHIVGHTATFRLYLRKSKGGKRIARLIDSPNLPEAEAVITISEEGVRD